MNARPNRHHSQGAADAMAAPKFSKHIIILCLKRRYPKQNSVICLKSSILAPPNFFAPSLMSDPLPAEAGTCLRIVVHLVFIA